MGALLALFQRKQERKPVRLGGGCFNALKNNWRGLMSTLVAIIIFIAYGRLEKESQNNMIAIWLSMFVFMLLLPMAVGGSALIAVFAVPMLGLLTSATVCGALSNENIVLFFMGGWLLLLINNCGADKRLVCWFLAQGDAGAYTPHKLLIKACFAAFCLSAIGEREMISQITMKYVAAALAPLKGVKGEANFQELSLILCNAIAVSSFLGSMCIVHASINTIQMRALFCESGTATTELPDVFNFLNYSAYAIPTVLIMFLLNLGYEAFLVSYLAGRKPASASSKELLKKTFKKNRQDLGPMTNHEKVSIGFLVLILLCFFTRWSKWLHYGWATFRHYEGTDISAVNDATTAAIFVVLLHFLPKSLHFCKLCLAKKHRDLPKMQPESGILYWKFVDKHTDYALFLLLGAGIILYKGMVKTKLNESIYYLFGKTITSLPWNVGILIVVLISVFLGTIMSTLAAQTCLMPLMLGMVGIREKITSLPWNLGILIVVLISVFLGTIMSTLAAQTCLMPLMLGMVGIREKITSLLWNVGILIVVLISVFLGTIMSTLAAQTCLMPLMLGMIGIREKINSLPWNLGILIVVLISVFLGTIMSTLAAQACLMPLMLGMAMTGQAKWPQRSYMVALGVGLGTGLGFASPFPNHPTYWVPLVGNVPRKKQIKYSIASQVICGVILWLSLCFFAPMLWDPDDHGIIPQLIPGLGVVTTTAAADAEAAPGL